MICRDSVCRATTIGLRADVRLPALRASTSSTKLDAPSSARVDRERARLPGPIPWITGEAALVHGVGVFEMFRGKRVAPAASWSQTTMEATLLTLREGRTAARDGSEQYVGRVGSRSDVGARLQGCAQAARVGAETRGQVERGAFAAGSLLRWDVSRCGARRRVLRPRSRARDHGPRPAWRLREPLPRVSSRDPVPRPGDARARDRRPRIGRCARSDGRRHPHGSVRAFQGGDAVGRRCGRHGRRHAMGALAAGVLLFDVPGTLGLGDVARLRGRRPGAARRHRARRPRHHAAELPAA